MDARDLVRAVGSDPRRTARTWLTASPDFPAGVDWSELALLALRHRVSGLVVDSLAAAGWLESVPVTVHEQLHHFAGMARSKQLELEAALVELAERHPAEVSRSVLLKGGALYPEYASRTHRWMNDFDLLFSGEDYDRVRDTFADLGYWLKESLNGPTFYRESTGPDGPLCMDVHVLGPSKYSRPAEALSPGWLTETEPYEVAGVALRRPKLAWQLVNVVTHVHEHLHSWIHAVGEDDVRSVRFADAELLVDSLGADPAEAGALARELGLEGEWVLGLWAWKQVRDELPAALDPLLPTLDRLDEVGELTALPRGRFATWPVPLRERAWLTDQLQLALDLEPEHAGRDWGALQQWYKTSGMLPAERERVEDIAERARQLVAGVPAGG